MTTFSQRYYGIHYSVSYFMTSWFITFTAKGFLNENTFPLFPGGMLVSTLLFINLLVAHFVRFKFQLRKLGIWLTHFSIILLIVGSALTHYLAVESLLYLRKGQPINYSEHSRLTELVIVQPSIDKNSDLIFSIQEKSLTPAAEILIKELPFSIKVLRFYKNSDLRLLTTKVKNGITQGIGSFIDIQEKRSLHRDDLRDSSSVEIELIDQNGNSLGTWLLSIDLDGYQRVVINGTPYFLLLRPLRFYTPYMFTLKQFIHEKYLGSTIPKNYESHIDFYDTKRQENRDIRLSMNRPFRYENVTYFQASFGEDDELSIIQVVKNRAWRIPYISCFLLAIGLCLQFIISLFMFLRRKRRQSRA
ncbi:MAG: cytochrome c biogenesis protein ResB [bacterium]